MSETLARVRGAVQSLVGQPIWSANAGPRDDYVLSLEIGDQQRRSLRLSNPRLSFLKRTYEGSHGVLVECPWRVDGPTGVWVSCFGVLEKKDPLPAETVAALEGRTIVGAEVRAPAWDLDLALSGGVTLRLFSLEVSARTGRDNWSIWWPEGSLRVGPYGHVAAPPPGDGPRDRLRKRLAALPDTP